MSRPMMDVLRASAMDLAQGIRDQALSSRDVVEAHIHRIEQVNPRINAVVADRFHLAREEARAADEAVAEGRADLGPLHGVPCTIKECFALSGMPQSGGLVARRNYRSRSDATAVARLRAAGAIPLGVTNLSELGMWMESANRLYGRTNNPYDRRRTAGGSSGGEGAIVGAGGSPFGLGSDIGGSIRIPAFFNGVFGHKATGGLVPGSGQFPQPENDAWRYLATGPIARRASDLYPLLQIMAGPDGEDPACDRALPPSPNDVAVPSLRVVTIDTDGRTPVHSDLRRAQQRVAAHLSRIGCEVRHVRLDALRRAAEIWMAMMSSAAETKFGDLLGNGQPLHLGREALRFGLGRSTHTLPALLLAVLEKAPVMQSKHLDPLIAMGGELRKELQDTIGSHGVMLYPSHGVPAPRHGAPLLRPTRWVYTAVFNAMEMPSTQVPLGLNPRGIPLGVQIAAMHGNDHLTIATAMELERAFGGWVPPET